jgi:hypothetical protein
MRWLLTGIAIGFAAFQLRTADLRGFKLEDSIVVSASQPEQAPAIEADDEESDEPVAEQEPSAEAVAPAAPATVPDENLAEYRIIDGLAVAYGDVIIGQRAKGSAATRGWHPIPVPQLWPSPVIPFHVDPALPDPERVHRALALLQQTTVLKFVPYAGTGDGVAFLPGTEHCLATLGRLGGLQPVKLAAGCGTGEVVHEILHVLGFFHEQSRSDRDRFIDVIWENIDEEYRGQFGVVPDSFMSPVRDSPFDFRSIMLYRADTFARQPGLSTFRSRDPEQAIAPMADGPSVEDVRRVNRLFGQ